MFVCVYIYIYQLQFRKSIQHPPGLFSFQVLAAVILVTFFFASAMNPGIIPRNESIPQEPPMGAVFMGKRAKKKNMTVESNGRMKNDIRKLYFFNIDFNKMFQKWPLVNWCWTTGFWIVAGIRATDGFKRCTSTSFFVTWRNSRWRNYFWDQNGDRMGSQRSEFHGLPFWTKT